MSLVVVRKDGMEEYMVYDVLVDHSDEFESLFEVVEVALLRHEFSEGSSLDDASLVEDQDLVTVLNCV